MITLSTLPVPEIDLSLILKIIEKVVVILSLNAQIISHWLCRLGLVLRLVSV